MYNKLFGKIVRSSIWLAPDPHRIVWITLLATMDEDGFADFASVENLAHTARVTPDECRAAVTAFESPDPHSGNPANEGRRIERVPGGWMVLNAPVYRDIVSRHESKRLNRERVQRFRERHGNAKVTLCNDCVTDANDPVMQSYSDTDQKKTPLPPNGGKPARKARSSKPALLPIADDFVLTPVMRQYAETTIPDCDPAALFERFGDQARAKAWVYADWVRAWQTYVRNCRDKSGHWAAGQYPKKSTLSDQYAAAGFKM